MSLGEEKESTQIIVDENDCCPSFLTSAMMPACSTYLPAIVRYRRYVGCSWAQDNYVWILQESGSGKIAVVDPSEAAPVAKALDERYAGVLYIGGHFWLQTGPMN